MAIDMHSHWYPKNLVEALKSLTGLPCIKPGDGNAHMVSLGNRMLNAITSMGAEEATPLTGINNDGAQAIEPGVSLYGADRIMFGTDGSAFGAEWSMRAIEDARIEEWEKQAILEGTAASPLPGHTEKPAAATGGAA